MNFVELIWWPIHFSETFCFMAAANWSSGASGTQQILHVRFFDGEQAVAHLAVRRQAETVAVQAERLADGSDESDFAAAIGIGEIGGGSAQVAVRELRPAGRFRAKAAR